MRILVVGAGAIGSVVGGFLAQHGLDVTLIGRASHMNAIAAKGLRVTGIWGEHCIGTLETRCDVPASAAFDCIIVAVKAYDTEQAMHAVAHLIGPGTLVLAYQNGLGNAEAIAARAGWQRTVGVRAIYGAVIPEAGTVDVTVIAQPTAIGPWTEEAPAERIRGLAGLMNAAGLPTVFSEDIGPVLWAKVAYNCMLNPLSALLDVPYGALATTEYTRAVMQTVAQELYAVGLARGIRLQPHTADAYLEHFYTTLLPPTAAHFASMREDLRRGRRTEIDALNGAIARFGAETGIATPVNSLLTQLIHARELLIAPRATQQA